MTDRPQVRIIDACFAGAKSSIGGDNTDLPPKEFDWYRGDEQVSTRTWYTSWTLLDALKDPNPMKVAWLIEPPSIQDWPYDFVRDKSGIFEAILTYDRDLWFLNDPPFKLIPHGGSWIRAMDWVMRPKERKTICMIASEKDVAEGHRLRHQIAQRFGDRIVVWGRGYKPFDRKAEVLADYDFEIVVESMRMDYYFTEKLIDCFALGNAPIYWGDPQIKNTFDINGIEPFESLDKLSGIIAAIDIDTLSVGSIPRIENFKRATKYFRPEDWAYERYPELFT